MIGWLSLTDEQRKATLEQAAQQSGITAKVIEKDWWVTLTLRTLFQTRYAQYMVFKGGTSLSKCWNLIQRFSEDIDIALDPQAFGMAYKEHPTKGDVARLKRKGCEFTSTTLKETLENQFAELGMPAGAISIIEEEVSKTMPDKDPQALFVNYSSLYEPDPYFEDRVKIEVSVRSLLEPHTLRKVQSILYEAFPNPIYAETPFDIPVVEPRRTFLEKTFLLHEEFLRPDASKIRIERMSRHLYDLVKMMQTDIADQALNDLELYQAVRTHRENYSRLPWVDYETLERATISFVPPDTLLDAYQEDYAFMLEQMIYEKTVSFEEIINNLKLLLQKFRKTSA